MKFIVSLIMLGIVGFSDGKNRLNSVKCCIVKKIQIKTANYEDDFNTIENLKL